MMPASGEKTVVVTGATSGIGLAVAEGLARQGISLIGVGRDAARCEQAAERVRALQPGTGRVTFLLADLALQSNVRSLTSGIRQVLLDWGANGLEALVNNAATVPFQRTITSEGFDLSGQ